MYVLTWIEVNIHVCISLHVQVQIYQPALLFLYFTVFPNVCIIVGGLMDWGLSVEFDDMLILVVVCG